jgi:hypothetical protein
LFGVFEITNEANYQNVIIEGDAKVCLDALLGDTSTYPWKLRLFAASMLWM